MGNTSYRTALELEGQLLQEIAYQEQVLENAGECYDGHSEDVNDCKVLLTAIQTFIKSCEKNKGGH